MLRLLVLLLQISGKLSRVLPVIRAPFFRSATTNGPPPLPDLGHYADAPRERPATPEPVRPAVGHDRRLAHPSPV